MGVRFFPSVDTWLSSAYSLPSSFMPTVYRLRHMLPLLALPVTLLFSLLYLKPSTLCDTSCSRPNVVISKIS